MGDRLRAWTAALSVLLLTLGAVGSDLFDRSVRDYWSHHSFTSSVVSGVLVLLLTVLLVDRVNSMRRIKDRSLAVGAQAAVILVQARRTADAIKRSRSDEALDEASQELRSYMQMLLTSAPVLIEAKASRTFLEAAQHTAGQFYRQLQTTVDHGRPDIQTKMDAAVQELDRSAAPLLKPLNRDQRAAVASNDELSEAVDG